MKLNFTILLYYSEDGYTITISSSGVKKFAVCSRMNPDGTAPKGIVNFRGWNLLDMRIFFL
ncbi:MAG: hypothetical protein HXS48_28225 [Theionarchaea archaeon]|nr:hypothetical protein [Theionarchaea archaeon]